VSATNAYLAARVIAFLCVGIGAETDIVTVSQCTSYGFFVIHHVTLTQNDCSFIQFDVCMLRPIIIGLSLHDVIHVT